MYRDSTDAWRLIEGDALAVLTSLPDDAIDAVVCDPPYGIAFHDEAWDGAGKARHLDGAAFTAWTREWAAECKRVLKPGGYLVAFGAPRTFHRLTSGIEDAGLEIRDVLLWLHAQGAPKSRRLPGGLGTALKPAYEPILLARKPLIGTTSRNLEAWGTGALNIEASRVDGRWPAHIALSHAPQCSATLCAADCPAGRIDVAHPALGPSRLFFCAKASKRERETGCEELPLQSDLLFSRPSVRLRRNIHPTVKPVALMRWVVALVTPQGGVVLDPFAGSGSTGIAAALEGRTFLGIEREARYIDIACARLTHWAHEATKESA
jgi:site-specific DNA-methyltransferase (adenine-specific)